MKFTPQDLVAVILAAGVIIFFVGGIIRALATEGPSPEVIVNMWADIIKVTLGGLIGYMSAHRNG